MSAIARRVTLLFFGLLCSFAASARGEEVGYALPDKIQVMPILFVPRDEPVPPLADQQTILRHLAWTQERYGQLLGGDTFEIAQPRFETIRGDKALEVYRNRPEGGAPDITAEILRHLKLTRFRNPYVVCIAFANSRDEFPQGGGRPINGGFNTGGGMMYISSSEVHRNRRYQATLQHELGHAFGLLHPDAYGYDIKTDPSVMSYSEANYTDGFRPSPTPGTLIPEDRRGLALADRIFRKTTFDLQRDIPANRNLSPKVLTLPPMTLPGHPDFYPKVTTDAGENVGSKVVNVVSGEIRPSRGPGVTYDPANMWHSDRDLKEPATLEFEFPFEIEATGIAIHSQHSGLDHEVSGMELLACDEPVGKKPKRAPVKKPPTGQGKDPKGAKGPPAEEGYRSLVKQGVTTIDEVVTFEKTRARRWRLVLEPDESRTIVIRGVRFLNGDAEVIPRQVPFDPSSL